MKILNAQPKRLLSIKDVFNEYGVTVWYWRTRIWSGELPFISVGRKHLIDRADLEAFINKNKKTNPGFN